MVHDEHQRQGAAVVTVRNIITSMRMIADVDWPELFERISLVDDVLSVGSTFRDMDFPTRNLYRSAIEELSRGADRHGSSTSPALPSRQQGRQHARRSASRQIAAQIPATIFSPADVAHSRRPSASDRRPVRGPNA